MNVIKKIHLKCQPKIVEIRREKKNQLFQNKCIYIIKRNKWRKNIG